MEHLIEGSEMLKKHWYELDYEDEPNDCTTVLYTSKEGLEALTNEMQRIYALKTEGRHPIILSDPDEEYEAPFTHIEIRKIPQEEPDDETLEDFAKQWKKPLFLIGSAIVVVGFLSLYGLVRLVIDVV